MTKSERLLHLIGLLRNKGPLSIAELSNRCGISRRTVYRDINSLLKMNIPVVYDDGYQIVGDTSLPAIELSAEELDLLRYACCHNPASWCRYFRRRFRVIEDKLKGKVSITTCTENDLFEVDLPSSDGQPAGDGAAEDHLEAFCSAIRRRRKVLIELNGARADRRYCIPRRVRLTGDGVLLVVQGEQPQEDLELDFADVHAVHVTSEVFYVPHRPR